MTAPAPHEAARLSARDLANWIDDRLCGSSTRMNALIDIEAAIVYRDRGAVEGVDNPVASVTEHGPISAPFRLHTTHDEDVSDRFTWHRARDGSITATLADGPYPLAVIDPVGRDVRKVVRHDTLRWRADADR